MDKIEFTQEIERLNSSILLEKEKLGNLLAELERKRDLVIGMQIAEETKDYPAITEQEALGMASRWYNWREKQIVSEGYRYQKLKISKKSEEVNALSSSLSLSS